MTRRIIERDPPRPSIEHPLLAIEAALAVGSLAHLLKLPWWWWPIGGLLAALVGSWIARRRSHQRFVAVFVAITSGVAGVLVALGSIHGPWSLVTIGVLGACAIVLAPLYGLTRHREEQREVQEFERIAVERAEAKRHDWVVILDEAGLKGVAIEADLNEHPWTAGERTFPAGFALALLLGKGAPDVKALPSYTAQIEKIAAGRGLPIRVGTIQASPRGYANQAELIVPTRDVLREDFPIVRQTGPRSVNDPIYWATTVDGMRLGWNPMLDPHGMFIGQTNKGKTTGLNAHAFELTRCEDNVTFMISGKKAERAFAPWLHPFLMGMKADTDTGFVEPVIDWIAGDVVEAGLMLLDVYKAISVRQEMGGVSAAEKWIPSPTAPRITLLIDESPDLLNNDRHKVKPCDWDGPSDEEDEKDGRKTGKTISDLLLDIIRLARSEGISVIFLTQRGTGTMNGANTGDMKSQISYRAGWAEGGGNAANEAFNTNTASVDLETLTPGEVYVEMAGYFQPLRAKSDYPSREDIAYAAINHSKYCHPLDDATADRLDYYRERWTRPSQQAFLRRILPTAVRTIPRQKAPDLAAMTAGTVVTPVSPEVEPHEGSGPTESPAAPGATDRGGDLPHLKDLTPAEQLKVIEQMYREAGEEPFGGVPALHGEEELPPPPEVIIDPKLPRYTRDLLRVLASSNLLYGEWLPSADILALAIDELGWPPQAPGFKRVSEALAEVDVVKPRNRPKREGNRLPMGYRVADIVEAVKRVTIRRGE